MTAHTPARISPDGKRLQLQFGSPYVEVTDTFVVTPPGNATPDTPAQTYTIVALPVLTEEEEAYRMVTIRTISGPFSPYMRWDAWRKLDDNEKGEVWEMLRGGPMDDIFAQPALAEIYG